MLAFLGYTHASTMPPKTLNTDERLNKLEEFRSEQESTLRFRLEGFHALEAWCVKESKGAREFWRVKQQLVDLMWPDLCLVYQEPDSTPLKQEAEQCLKVDTAVMGVFPLGGHWGEQKCVDYASTPALWLCGSITL